MDYSHLGWIPCVNGHLDFGLMKPTLCGGFTDPAEIDRKTTCVSYSYSFKNNSHHARRFLMQSKVNWRDTAKEYYDGWFRVFVVAESNISESLDSRFLNGTVYLYRSSAIESDIADERHQSPQFKLIHQAKSTLDDYNTNNDKWGETVASLDNNYNDLKKHFLTMQEVYPIHFEVKPNGLTYICLDKESKADEETAYALLRQAFYYLKYSLHEHKHHDDLTDSLTTIVPYDNTTDGKKNSSLKMIGQLKRELTTIKRSYSMGENVTHTNAQGVISYLNSLIWTCYNAKFIDKETKERESEYLKSVSSSFSAQTKKIETKEHNEEKIRSKNRIVFGWILSIISILILLCSRFYFRPLESKKLTELSMDLDTFLVTLMTITLIIFFIYFRYTKYCINKEYSTEEQAHWIKKHYMNVSTKAFSKTISMRTFIYIFVSAILFSGYLYVERNTVELEQLLGLTHEKTISDKVIDEKLD